MNIGIIGHFGGNEKFNDGQTVKTINIYNGLYNCGITSVDKIDTYYIKRNPIKFMFDLIKSLFKDKKYIVLLSINGRRILFPVLYMFSRFGKEIYHYSIGGRLAREIIDHPLWKRYISAFNGNWMESHELTSNLQYLGIKNAKYIPNFKKLEILNEGDLIEEYTKPYKFCIFSRVMKEKGVSDAINAINTINTKYGSRIATLDIYGPIDPTYENELFMLLNSSNDTCKYCGIIDSHKSVDALKSYYALLFPTHWKHEGIPGTIIDALSAGVPVIAREWQYCKEMITLGENGYYYEFDRPELLIDTMLYTIENEKSTMDMKKNCIKRAYEYSEDYVMAQIKSEMRI